MATNGPDVQSEQRQVRMFPLVACTIAKTCPGHWLAMVMLSEHVSSTSFNSKQGLVHVTYRSRSRKVRVGVKGKFFWVRFLNLGSHEEQCWNWVLETSGDGTENKS